MDALKDADRRIEGRGTTAQAWRDCARLGSIPDIALDDLVPPGRRLIVVAPHPDDEILGCGGLVALLMARQRGGADAAASAVSFVGVTDGEASHLGSMNWTPPRLAARRRQERVQGLRRLGWCGEVQSLKLPDGGIRPFEVPLAAALARQIEAQDVLVTTWRLDGHPDHEATGRACAQAAAATGARLLEMPVWTWHWAAPGDARVPWQRMRRLPLGEAALRIKRVALAAHRSQLQADGDTPPVLFPEAVERCMQPFETFILPEDRR